MTAIATEITHLPIKKISFAWTSGSGGTVTKQTDNVYTGEVIRLVTIPDSGDAPTPDYDIEVLDQDETDVLMGAGADRHTSTTEQVLASSLGCMVASKLTLSVAAAGDSKSGVAHVYIRG